MTFVDVTLAILVVTFFTAGTLFLPLPADFLRPVFTTSAHVFFVAAFFTEELQVNTRIQPTILHSKMNNNTSPTVGCYLLHETHRGLEIVLGNAGVDDLP